MASVYYNWWISSIQSKFKIAANSQMENSVNDMFKEKYVILIGDGLETLISIVLGTNGMDNSLSEAIFKQKLSFS